MILFADKLESAEHGWIALTSAVSAIGGWEGIKNRWRNWARPAIARFADAMPPLGPDATFKEKWLWSWFAGFRTKPGA